MIINKVISIYFSMLYLGMYVYMYIHIYHLSIQPQYL